MERKELIKKGKSSIVYATSNPAYLELESIDAVNGFAKNAINVATFKFLERNNIPTHFVSTGTTQSSIIVRKTNRIPLQIICKLKTLESFCKHYNCDNIETIKPLVEYTYNDKAIDRQTILAISKSGKSTNLNLNETELDTIDRYTVIISQLLSTFYDQIGSELINCAVEYGRLPDDQIILCDISTTLFNLRNLIKICFSQ